MCKEEENQVERLDTTKTHKNRNSNYSRLGRKNKGKKIVRCLLLKRRKKNTEKSNAKLSPSHFLLMTPLLGAMEYFIIIHVSCRHRHARGFKPEKRQREKHHGEYTEISRRHINQNPSISSSREGK